MQSNHFYVTLYSIASQEIYPDNKQAAFTIHLAQPIDLGSSSDWEVGLREVTYKPPKRHIVKGTVVEFISEINALIYCDLIAPQFVGQNKVRVLRPIILWPVLGKQIFQNIYYLPVEKTNFEIYVLK